MDTKKLQELGLTEEQIKAVMSDFGEEHNALKNKNKEFEDIIEKQKEEIALYQDNLNKFKDIDVDGIENQKKQIEELEQLLKDNENKYKNSLAERDLNELISGELRASKAKNEKAVKALLDIENLKTSKNQKEDLVKMIEEVKKDNGFMFESDEPINNPVVEKTTIDEPTKDNINALRQAMGLSLNEE